MSRLALLTVLVTASPLAARAQPADSAGAVVPRAELVLGGVVGGVATWYLADRAVIATGGESGWGALAYPVGVAAGVAGIAAARGAEVPFGRALRGSGQGALIGYLGALGLAAVADPNPLADEDAWVFVVAGALVVGSPVLGAVAEVAPARIRTPSGEVVPGASLVFPL